MRSPDRGEPAPAVGDFAGLPEQAEAKRLLRAALHEGPAHAYLFHGPEGVGKRRAAFAFAAAVLGEDRRVERRTHPDLYVLEPLGDQIRIDAVRDLRHDLHLRPFEAARRVYLILAADLMNEEAADALLKDLEEPPPYAVIVLVASQPGRLPETIRSRCQLVPFRRLSRRALEEYLEERRPELEPEARSALARLAGGRIDRAERLLDPAVGERRRELIQLARRVYGERWFDTGAAARAIVGAAKAAGAAAASGDAGGAEGTARELEQRSRRVARGVEREEVLEAIDLLGGWYRDLLAVGLGARGTVLNADRLPDLEADAGELDVRGAAQAVEAVTETRRTFELNVNPTLGLDALLVRIRHSLQPAGPGPSADPV